MKKTVSLLIVLLLTTFSFAQDVKKDDWIRVQSDDGEFSIEVPAKYGYFYDKNGTFVFDNSGNYSVEEMNVFNSYFEHTLLSFETYKASKSALEAIKKSDERNTSKQNSSNNWSEIKQDNYKIKQLISKNDKHYTVRKYFHSKQYIYVLTASSRLGETSAMKHFFESLTFKPDATGKLSSKDTRFPNLKATQIEYEENFEKPKKDDKTTTPIGITQSDSTIKPLIVLNMPSASYMEKGEIRLKVTFSEFGQITKIVVLKQLTTGSLRNTALAALRMKVIPQEKDDKPVSVTRTIEYRFSIG
jgi:Gram-negative bacterial TonB protein C-terminal